MEDFVPYELAVKLNEVGFNYDTKEVYEINISLERYFEIPKPTIPQVLKWLREEKKIYISVEVEREDWFEYKIVQTIKNTRTTGTRVYETYLEAILAGIAYVIDNNLI